MAYYFTAKLRKEIGDRLKKARKSRKLKQIDVAVEAGMQFSRCIVPATGFFEWKRVSDGKVPYHIKLKTEGLFGFAGLILKMKDINGEEKEVYEIITTAPNETMKPIHNRMPVILAKEDEDMWLDPDITEPERLLPLLKPYPDSEMEAYPISKAVNSPANNDVRILNKVDEDA